MCGGFLDFVHGGRIIVTAETTDMRHAQNVLAAIPALQCQKHIGSAQHGDIVGLLGEMLQRQNRIALSAAFLFVIGDNDTVIGVFRLGKCELQHLQTLFGCICL